ncbi:MAG TPA: hypothetical protein VJY34_01045, partial [Roseiarcus sp.]|nr:hypothetical protein [Roseiarcus sp.]
RRLSGGSAPKRKVCGGSDTVNGENLDIFDGGGPIPALLAQIGHRLREPFHVDREFRFGAIDRIDRDLGRGSRIQAFDHLILQRKERLAVVWLAERIAELAGLLVADPICTPGGIKTPDGIESAETSLPS